MVVRDAGDRPAPLVVVSILSRRSSTVQVVSGHESDRQSRRAMLPKIVQKPRASTTARTAASGSDPRARSLAAGRPRPALDAPWRERTRESSHSTRTATRNPSATSPAGVIRVPPRTTPPVDGRVPISVETLSRSNTREWKSWRETCGLST